MSAQKAIKGSKTEMKELLVVICHKKTQKKLSQWPDLELVRSGVDMFETSFPSYLAENGQAFVFDNQVWSLKGQIHVFYVIISLVWLLL